MLQLKQFASAQAEVMGMMPFFHVKFCTPCGSRAFGFASGNAHTKGVSQSVNLIVRHPSERRLTRAPLLGPNEYCYK